MASLLGFTSLAFVSLLTYLLAIRYPDISKVLFVGLILRIFLLLIDNYIFSLPGSDADAESFEGFAKFLSKDGFFYLISNFSGPDPYFISYFIAIPYSLFGVSVMMAQSIGLLFGIGSIFLAWSLAEKLWNKRIANTVGWVVALFPTLILFSVIVLREVYICFFILLALHGLVGWVKTEKFKYVILATISFIGATFFHGAMIVGLIVFISIVAFSSLRRCIKLLKNYRINLSFINFLILFTVASVTFLSNKISVPYLGTFEQGSNIEILLQKTYHATAGEASWPKWTIANSPIELLYKAPIRSMYVIFSPFPWDVTKIKHFIGMLDGLLYFYLTILILLNIKTIWNDRCLRIILIILLAYIFVFGIGVGNFGTGIRHRSKFVVMFILLAAPMLKRVILQKKNDKI